MPTREWKAATSCGIAVIGTRRAITAPIAAADRHAAQDQAEPRARRPGRQSTASCRRRCAMPIMP